MRILMYADWHLRYASRLACALQNHGATVAFMARDHSLEFSGRTSDRDFMLAGMVDAGVEVSVLGGRYWSSKTVGQVLSTTRAWRRFRPDVIHIQQNSDPRIIAATRIAPLVTTVHEPYLRDGDTTDSTGFRRATRRFDDYYRGHSKAVVVHTQGHLSSLEAAGHTNVVEIPHGVLFQLSPEAVPRETCVLHFGRSAAYKGVEDVIAAVELLRQSSRDVSLRILCSGGRPEGIVEPRENWYRATWDGYSENELAAALKEASVVALPYRNASGSGAASAAVAHGVPLVVTPLEGLKELVTLENQICTPGDIRSLAKSIDFVSGISQAERSAMHATLINQFDWSAIAVTHMQLYRRITSR